MHLNKITNRKNTMKEVHRKILLAIALYLIILVTQLYISLETFLYNTNLVLIMDVIVSYAITELIFKEINHYLKTGKKLEITKKDKVKLFFEYVKLCEKYDFVNVLNLKHTALNFCKGFEGSKELRVRMEKIRDKEEIIEEVRRFGKL